MNEGGGNTSLNPMLCSPREVVTHLFILRHILHVKKFEACPSILGCIVCKGIVYSAYEGSWKHIVPPQ